MPAAKSPNLRKKIATIVGSIGDIEPDGYNKFHNYHYFSDEQISGLFRQRFADAGIILVPDVEAFDIREFTTGGGKPSFLTTLHVRWSLLDADSDETITARTVGQGDDPGDKGSNKAMTGAFKYLLIKLAQIGGEGDAEADEKADERHVKSEAAKPKVGDSDIKGVERGGRNANATDAQITKVRQLAADLGLNAAGVATVVEETLPKTKSKGIEAVHAAPEDQQGPALVAFLGQLAADDIGKVVSALDDAKHGADEPVDDGTGYGS